MWFLFILLGPVYIFFKIQESDDYSKDVLPLVIFYLIADVILAFISYGATGGTIAMVFTGIFIRTGLFYLLARLNLSIKNPIISTILFAIALYLTSLALVALFISSQMIYLGM